MKDFLYIDVYCIEIYTSNLKKKTVSFVKYRNLQFKKIILACITLNDGRGQL